VSIWKHLITFVVYIIYYESTFVKRLIKNLRVAALRFFHFFMCGNMNIISFVVTYIIYHRFIFVKGLKKYSLFLTKMKSPECQLWGFRSCETHELLFYHLWLFILYTTNLFLSRGKRNILLFWTIFNYIINNIMNMLFFHIIKFTNIYG
jgi:hypothetical protein